MINWLNKECRLAASPLSWIMLAAALLTLVPGYPILLSAFFVGLGLMHSFQNAREANDVLYSVLLPAPKGDYVRAKYAFACLIELIAFALTAALTALRMTALAGAAVYRTNALMNAGPLSLAFTLLIYAAFNVLFIGGHFRTAYALGFPFLRFGLAALVLVVAAESLHFFPGMAYLNAPAGERLGPQFAALAAAAALYALATFLSCRRSVRRFETLDL